MVMPYQDLKAAIFGEVPMLNSPDSKFPILPGQIQAASVDLRLSRTVYRMRSAALPHNEHVIDLIEKYRKYSFELEPQQAKYFEVGQTYIVPLLEHLALPKDTFAEFTAKSSTGRIDVFARVLCDKVSSYDVVPMGYHGPAYLEITPLSHDVKVQAGLSLVQGRFKTAKTRRVLGEELTRMHMQRAILFGPDGKPLSLDEMQIENDEMYFHIDLARDVVGFVAKNTSVPIDMTAIEGHEPDDFWEPIRRPKDGQLVLLPGKFYLLATKERVRIPPEVCGQVQAFRSTTGEIRPHYAGFFDNGFGGTQGTHGVLEVRSRDVPFRIVDGQPICAMQFEYTFAVPDVLYGQEGSNYTQNGPSLSKHFKHRYDAWNTGLWHGLW